MVDKSTNKVQFRQMEKSIQIILTIGISFGSRPIADYFHDQTICIADCENLTIGHSLIWAVKNLRFSLRVSVVCVPISSGGLNNG